MFGVPRSGAHEVPAEGTWTVKPRIGLVYPATDLNLSNFRPN